jgi:Cys-tRNA(Pro)/Cys-tRNA(Cys) deacylase
MSNSTRATLALGNEGVTYNLHPYDYAPAGEGTGMQAALALGVEPGRVLKTLMVKAGRQAACVIVPSDREVKMKALAGVLGVKAAEMMKPADAERLTGYRVGGISPFGQRQGATNIFEEDALAFDVVYINAGQRGLLLSIDPADAVRVLGATVAAISE